MSRGKQWWPERAGPEDVQAALADFQVRLRERQMLKNNEGAGLFHVYMADGGWDGAEQLESANSYMQFGSQDSGMRRQGRVPVLRLLSTLLKWQVGLGGGAIAVSPGVFASPDLAAGGWRYGLVARMAGSNGKSISLVVSDHDISGGQWRGKHWRVAQTGDSYRWLAVERWSSWRKQPAFGKWAYGSYSERKTWVETGAWKKDGGLSWDGDFGDPAGRALGAIFDNANRCWVLPEFWELDAVQAWIAESKINLAQPKPSWKRASNAPHTD